MKPKTNARRHSGAEIILALRQRLTSGAWAPGTQIPTEEALCAEFGVCRATMNKALKEIERLGLLRSCRGKGRTVLGGGEKNATPSHTIAVVTIDLSQLTHPVQVQKLTGIQTVLHEHNYHLNLIAVHQTRLDLQGHPGLATDWAKLVNPATADGVIVLPGEAELDQVEQLARQLPVVWLDHATQGPRLAGVRLDFLGGIFQGTRHLTDLGHRRIGFVWPESFTETFHLMMDGMRLALMPLPDAAKPVHYHTAQFSTESGSAAAREFLADSQRPTAMICGSDELFNGFYATVVAAGIKVPQELSIISWNDHSRGTDPAPNPTCVYLPYAQAGAACARRLLRMIEQQEIATPAADELIMTELRLGETTAPPT